MAQNVFQNTLIKEIIKQAPGANPATIIAAGATHFRAVTPPEFLPGVLLAYNNAVTRTYIVSIATALLAFLSSFLFEMKSVKGKNVMGGGAA